MVQLIEVIILGIIQGITEWLPISSSGHLILFDILFGLNTPILFDVILHVGTLVVVITFFRKEILKIILASRRFDFQSEDGKILPLVIVGVVPTFLIGLIFGGIIEEIFQTIAAVSIAMIVTGFILFATRMKPKKSADIGYSTAVIIGIAQGIAIIPGISRSGITISVALLLGAYREKAFSFSFLISIPAILGALGLTLYTDFDELAISGLGGIEILAGLMIAMIVGFLSLKILRKIILEKRFYLFSFYCWIVGISLLLSSLIL